jgi:hypothetical protein
MKEMGLSSGFGSIVEVVVAFPADGNTVEGAAPDPPVPRGQEFRRKTTMPTAVSNQAQRCSRRIAK